MLSELKNQLDDTDEKLADTEEALVFVYAAVRTAERERGIALNARRKAYKEWHDALVGEEEGNAG